MLHKRPPGVTALKKALRIFVLKLLKSVFYCLKSQGPLKWNKNCSDNSLNQDLLSDTTFTPPPFFSFSITFKSNIRPCLFWVHISSVLRFLIPYYLMHNSMDSSCFACQQIQWAQEYSALTFRSKLRAFGKYFWTFLELWYVRENYPWSTTN